MINLFFVYVHLTAGRHIIVLSFMEKSVNFLNRIKWPYYLNNDSNKYLLGKSSKQYIWINCYKLLQAKFNNLNY